MDFASFGLFVRLKMKYPASRLGILSRPLDELVAHVGPLLHDMPMAKDDPPVPPDSKSPEC